MKDTPETDSVLAIYNQLKREADEARKAMELTQANLKKAMKIAKELNKAMWRHHHNQGANDRLHKLEQELKGHK